MSTYILLVEDDPSLGYLLSEYLKLNGFGVEWRKDGASGLEALAQQRFDLCILDIMMPVMDGYTLAAAIRRQYPEQAFLFLSARSLKPDVHMGLSLGAEDYIKKPVDEEELVLRIRNILRRTQRGLQEPEKLPTALEIGLYRYEPEARRLSLGSNTHSLSAREHELLMYLASRQGRLCERSEMLRQIWGQSDYFTRKSMDVFVSKLRKLLAGDPRIQIENVHGKGFILRVMG